MAASRMQTLLSAAWIERVIQALAEVFYHAIAGLQTVSCELAASLAQAHWHVLLSALTLAGLTLASLTALGHD